MIGGVDATSNVYSAFKYDLPVSGTMAHSWVQAFTDELTAFREYARHNPDDTVLLVDTYDTLGSGVPNAITVAKELEKSGHKLQAIRLDSGDLAYFSHQSRKMLDESGLDYVKIAASNQLDEYLIFSLITQKAPIDIFGVGTRLITAQDTPALDGVYKLSETDHKPTLKISENIEKITLPGRKRILRYLNNDGTYYGDGIIRADEESPERIYHPYFPAKKSYVGNIKHYELLEKVFENGKIIKPVSDVKESASYCAQQLNKLSPEYKRFDNPHIYKVGISESLMKLRDELLSTLKPDSL
jgi:nicotinate phosphoribosyltransferase